MNWHWQFCQQTTLSLPTILPLSHSKCCAAVHFSEYERRHLRKTADPTTTHRYKCGKKLAFRHSTLFMWLCAQKTVAAALRWKGVIHIRSKCTYACTCAPAACALHYTPNCKCYCAVDSFLRSCVCTEWHPTNGGGGGPGRNKCAATHGRAFGLSLFGHVYARVAWNPHEIHIHRECHRLPNGRRVAERILARFLNGAA